MSGVYDVLPIVLPFMIFHFAFAHQISFIYRQRWLHPPRRRYPHPV